MVLDRNLGKIGGLGNAQHDFFVKFGAHLFAFSPNCLTHLQTRAITNASLLFGN